MPTPPRAPRRPHLLTAHGDTRTDDWYWLRDRDDPEVIAYLEAENEHTREVLAPLRPLQQQLYAQMRERIKETDTTAPVFKRGWWYYSRTVEGLQYAIHCRVPDPERRWQVGDLVAALEGEAPGGDAAGGGPPLEQVVLDENDLAGDSGYFALGVFDIDPDQRLLAHAVDLDGSERYLLRFRDLDTGADLPDRIEGVYYSSAWGGDGRTFFYVRTDDAMRPHQVWRHLVGQPPEADELIFEDPDERFFVSVGATRSERFVLVAAESKITSEVHALDASQPHGALSVIEPRRHGVEYSVEHAEHPTDGDVWLVLTNLGGADNFALLKATVANPGLDRCEVVIAHRPEVRLQQVDAFADHVVVVETERALDRLRVIRWADGDDHVIEQPEPVYSLTGAGNPEFATGVVRFGYTSLVTPMSTVEYDVAERQRRVVRRQPVLGGYDPAAYGTTRLWAPTADGKEVPISLVHARTVPLDGSAPCLLYGYGSYEHSVDPTFSSLRLNLLERGFVFAIAHVRGGGELGRAWYEDGKLDRKQHTFSDFITCAEHLVAAGYTHPERLVARGGSAGGLLMGAVANQRPELWRAIVAEVPFVDCLTTMQDESLPLTVTEWEEWGNPVTDPAIYAYMKAYSPYDNVRPVAYPAMFVSGGLNDPRVGFWEPAKWVAKLRATRRDDRPLVLKTEMGAGHGGPSGRYDAWEDEAQIQAFILDCTGKG